VELRRFKRAPIDCPVHFALADEKAFREGVAVDLSVGGMFIRTASPAAFSAPIRIRLIVPGVPSELVLPATVRWTRPDGMGVQFGLLGARETFAITEFVRQAEHARASARARV
jgi:type IV pilus assembly protein PilZ